MFSILGLGFKNELNSEKNKIVETSSVFNVIEKTPHPIPVPIHISFSDLSDTEITSKLVLHKLIVSIVIKVRYYFIQINILKPRMKYFYFDTLDLLKMKYKTDIGFLDFINNIKSALYYNWNSIDEIIYHMCGKLEKCKDINYLNIFYELHAI